MNSPPEPGSPSPTTPSSGSPPPDELTLPPASGILPEITSPLFLNSPGASGSGSSKRQRNPTSYTSRDAKSRRKDESGAGYPLSGQGRRQGYTSGTGGGSQEGRQKDELVDVNLAETLKRQYGDPFDELELRRIGREE